MLIIIFFLFEVHKVLKEINEKRFRVEKGKEGKAYPPPKSVRYVFGALSIDMWMHYAAQTILVTIISGNTAIEVSYIH